MRRSGSNGEWSPGSFLGRPSSGRGALVPWPGPISPAQVSNGSLLIAATAPQTGVIVIRAIGEIDLLTAPGWERMLTAALAVLTSSPPGPTSAGTHPRSSTGPRSVPRLVCDLSPVSFLGAVGLTVLVELAAQSARLGIDLRVVTGSRATQRPLQLAGLDHQLSVETELEQAVRPSGAWP